MLCMFDMLPNEPYMVNVMLSSLECVFLFY
jgi:hypothetical protein